MESRQAVHATPRMHQMLQQEGQSDASAGDLAPDAGRENVEQSKDAPSAREVQGSSNKT
jgi:hypothetical protein